MVNYQNGKIYKIESNLGDKVYIGSTTKQYLSQRMVSHRKNYMRWKSGKRDLTTSFLLFDEYGIENCQIVLLETCSCDSKDALHAREAYYIRALKCVNKCIPGRTSKEYDNDNKDRIREYKQKYYIEKKDELKQKYESNKEQIADTKKARYQLNKESVKAKVKAYRDANKDEINKKRREKVAAKKLEQQSS